MAQPPFTRFQEKVFDIVSSTMGYDAEWIPVDGGSAVTGKVCFKDPHNDIELAGFPFTPRTHIAEWKQGDFAGLEVAFNTGTEQMTINDITYNVVHVKARWDGKTYMAVMERVNGD